MDALPIVFQETDSRGSAYDEVVITGHRSGTPYSSIFADYNDAITTTWTALPAGVSVRRSTTSSCTSNGGLITTASSGSTQETIVPDICTNGFVFMIFGLPAVGLLSGNLLSGLCHKLVSFLPGIIFRVLCPSGGPPVIVIEGVDPDELPPKGTCDPACKPDGTQEGDGDDDGDDKKTDVKATRTDVKATETDAKASEKQQQTSVVSTTRGRSTESASRTMSASASATSSTTPTATRYIIMSRNDDTSDSDLQALFNDLANEPGMTRFNTDEGDLDFFAVPLNQIRAEAIANDKRWIIMAESVLDIVEMDIDMDKPDDATAQIIPESILKARESTEKYKSNGDRLRKRVPLGAWMERITDWSMAMISLVPGMTLPQYDFADPVIDVKYPYYSRGDIQLGEGVRVYLFETGLCLLHPEFLNRVKPGRSPPQHEGDWNINWMFGEVDGNEVYEDDDGLQQLYHFNYIDPDLGIESDDIHPAFTDYAPGVEIGDQIVGHGSRLAAFILGDQLGLARGCKMTVVKIPMYTNGPRAGVGAANFPLSGVRSALGRDIRNRQKRGENLFVISTALGWLFTDGDPKHHPADLVDGFADMWSEYIDCFDKHGVAIVAATGNLGTEVLSGLQGIRSK